MLKVLFTGGGGVGSEALWKLYSDRYEMHFADANVRAIDPIIALDRCHEIPWASDPKFVNKINAICKQYKIDLLVPGVDEELLILAKEINRLAPTKIMLPNYNFVQTMSDKFLMIQALSKQRLPVPLTYLLKEDFSNIDFPCIVKPRKGRGSRGVRVIETKVEAEMLKRTLGEAVDKFVIQNKIEGQEYTVQMVANMKGQLLAVIPVKVDLKRGITINAKVENNLNVIGACRLIHEVEPTIGCYNIQLMLTDKGVVMPFEINPRISTTFCLVVAANVDPIDIFLGEGGLDQLVSFTDGVQLRRHWTNHFTNNKQ
jgi:carbamoyl-phosphate synthase large subunit